MKVAVTVSIGLVGCKKTRTLDFDDGDWNAMTDNERDEVLHETAMEMIEWGWKEKE